MAAAAVLLLGRRGPADTISWQAGADDWFNANNWYDQNSGLNQVPGASDDVYINNGGTAQISHGTADAGYLELDSGELDVSGGALNAGPIVVNASGAFVYNGGGLAVGNATVNGGSFTWQSGSGRFGTFTIENGGDFAFTGTDGSFYFGSSNIITGTGSQMTFGSGTSQTIEGDFNVAQGALVSVDYLYIGNSNTSATTGNGTLALSDVGSEVSTINEATTYQLNSTINQTGGSNSATGSIWNSATGPGAWAPTPSAGAQLRHRLSISATREAPGR
jgi:hypothetical protein